MPKSLFSGGLALMFSLAVLNLPAFCQQPAKKPVLQTAADRLTNAKSVLVTRVRGNGIPYDVIKTTLDGWGRFTLVESKDKADLVIEIATTGGDNGVRVSSNSGPSSLTGRPEQSTVTSRDFSNADITMTVYDAKNKRVLWMATETAKSALKQTTWENNLVEAAERLTVKFHDRLEPPPPKDTD